MNETIFLLLGVLGIAGIGALVSDNDDAQPPETPDPDPYGGRPVIEGTDEDDTIAGTAGNDAIHGFDGDDAINDGAGDDLVWGGRGEDTVAASEGDDLIYLGMHNDVYGQADSGIDEGNDTIVGGTGRDTIITNGGEHTIYGDRMDEDDDDDNGDNDRIEDHGGIVMVDAGEGDDVIWSPDDSDPDRPDTLLGGDGADTIYAGGYDIVDAGKGADLLILRSDSSGPADIAYGDADSLQVTLSQDYDGPENYELVQDGDDVRVVLDGHDIAILRETLVREVREISLVRAEP